MPAWEHLIDTSPSNKKKKLPRVIKVEYKVSAKLGLWNLQVVKSVEGNTLQPKCCPCPVCHTAGLTFPSACHPSNLSDRFAIHTCSQ